MHSRNVYLVAAVGALILFALAASVLIGNRMKAPINNSTRFTTIDWMDEKLTNPNGPFPNSTVVKDFHQIVITGAIEIHQALKSGWVEFGYTVNTILLLGCFAVLVALHFTQKSYDKLIAKSSWNTAADGRLTTSVSCNSEFEYVSFTRPGISIEQSAGSGEPMRMVPSSATRKNSAVGDTNLRTYLFPENAI